MRSGGFVFDYDCSAQGDFRALGQCRFQRGRLESDRESPRVRLTLKRRSGMRDVGALRGFVGALQDAVNRPVPGNDKLQAVRRARFARTDECDFDGLREASHGIERRRDSLGFVFVGINVYRREFFGICINYEFIHSFFA